MISLACLEYKILTVVSPAIEEEKKEENQEKKPERPQTASKMAAKSGSKTIKKTITEKDSFRFNDKFRSQLKRITINSI